MLRRAVFAVFLTLVTLLPAVASAQISADGLFPSGRIDIYDHPQATHYNSPAEWPEIDNQGHWCPGVGPLACLEQLSNMLRLTHGHVKCKYPYLGKITGPTRIGCLVMLYNIRGYIHGIDFGAPTFSRQALNTNVVWKHTGTADGGRMEGAPGEVRMWEFQVTLDPVNWDNRHGASGFTIGMRFQMEDREGRASVGTLNTLLPLFAALDTRQPLQLTDARTNPNYQMLPIMSDWSVSPGDGISILDSTICRTNGPIPLKPITAPWPIYKECGRYGSTANFHLMTMPTVTELLTDVNLHQLVPGRVLFREETDPRFGTTGVAYLDPAVLGPGKHATMLRTAAYLPSRDEESNALTTFTVEVPGDTPPPTDTDGDGVNDPDDHCPTVAGPVSNHGCPVGTPPPDLEAARRAKLTEVEQAFIALQSANIANVGQALITLGARLLELRALFGG